MRMRIIFITKKIYETCGEKTRIFRNGCLVDSGFISPKKEEDGIPAMLAEKKMDDLLKILNKVRTGDSDRICLEITEAHSSS